MTILETSRTILVKLCKLLPGTILETLNLPGTCFVILSSNSLPGYKFVLFSILVLVFHDFVSVFIVFSYFLACMNKNTKTHIFDIYLRVFGLLGLNLVKKRYVFKHIPKSPRLRYCRVLTQCYELTSLKSKFLISFY